MLQDNLNFRGDNVTGLVVRSAAKKAAQGMRVSGDFFDALDEKIDAMIKEAIKRAKANGRATCRGCDL